MKLLASLIVLSLPLTVATARAKVYNVDFNIQGTPFTGYIVTNGASGFTQFSAFTSYSFTFDGITLNNSNSRGLGGLTVSPNNIVFQDFEQTQGEKSGSILPPQGQGYAVQLNFYEGTLGVEFPQVQFSDDNTNQYGDNTLAPFATFQVATAATVTSAVPEPSTWSMMLLGFIGLGFLAYRRTRNADTTNAMVAA